MTGRGSGALLVGLVAAMSVATTMVAVWLPPRQAAGS